MSTFYLYAGFLAFVLLMLFADLKLFHAEEKAPSRKQSATWVAVWVSLAVAFGVIVYFWKGQTSAAEYFAGYLVEYSLSVDNMFVFLVVMSYFQVRPEHQHQVLFFGILGAIVFRGIFIALGATLISEFEWIVYVFGVLLLYTAFRIVRGTAEVHPEDNPILKLLKGRFRTTSKYDGQKLFTMENGKKVATPLFVVLVIIETTDIAFAVDSIPAIFAITRDPFIVLTSNVFAILGLRSLYFLLAGSIEKFHLLKYGLGIILAFVGVKMLLSDVWHPPIALSLVVIAATLLITAVASLLIEPKLSPDEVSAGAGVDELQSADTSSKSPDRD